jgi:hypothetical protein
MMETKLAQKENIKEISEIFLKLNTKDLDYTKIEDINKYIDEKRCYIVLKNGIIIAAAVYKIYE